MIFGSATLLSAQQTRYQPVEEYVIVHKKLPEFQLVGIAARTNNSKEISGTGVIGSQWQKFFRDGILDRIPNRVDSKIYALYTDYASDHNGDYTFVIGAAVKPGTNPPDGMVVKHIPVGRYAVISSDKGPLPSVVPAVWQRVWKLESEGRLLRTYKSDLEVYDERSRDPQEAVVDLYIGVN